MTTSEANMPNPTNNEEWRKILEKILPKLSERSWIYISAQIQAAEKRGKREGLEEAKKINSNLVNYLSALIVIKNKYVPKGQVWVNEEEFSQEAKP